MDIKALVVDDLPGPQRTSPKKISRTTGNSMSMNSRQQH